MNSVFWAVVTFFSCQTSESSGPRSEMLKELVMQRKRNKRAFSQRSPRRRALWNPSTCFLCAGRFFCATLHICFDSKSPKQTNSGKIHHAPNGMCWIHSPVCLTDWGLHWGTRPCPLAFLLLLLRSVQVMPKTFCVFFAVTRLKDHLYSNPNSLWIQMALWVTVIDNNCNVVTFTLRAFSRRFYPQRLA